MQKYKLTLNKKLSEQHLSNLTSLLKFWNVSFICLSFDISYLWTVVITQNKTNITSSWIPIISLRRLIWKTVSHHTDWVLKSVTINILCTILLSFHMIEMIMERGFGKCLYVTAQGSNSLELQHFLLTWWYFDIRTC